jgi:hypothetical protein
MDHHTLTIWVSIGSALFVAFAFAIYAAFANGKDTDA